VVLLIDLLAPAGWRLAEDGLIDTLIGGAIVLPIGFAPWPMSWYAHLPQRFAETARGVSAYLLEALQTSAAPTVRRGALPPPSPSALRQLADALRAASEATATGTRPKAEPEPPDETLKPVGEAMRALLGMLGDAERLTTPG
jgi:hypothetical protein